MALLTSFAGMAYEIVLAQTIAFLSDEVVFWESLSIGFFIAATGLGVFIFDKRSEKNLLHFFIKAEVSLAILGLLSLPIIYGFHIIYRIYIVDYASHTVFTKPLNWIMLCCQMPIILIGLLNGIELRSLFETKFSQNIILALYHLGALLASLFFAVLVYQKIDTYYLMFLGSITNSLIILYSLSFVGKNYWTQMFLCSLFAMIYTANPNLWRKIQNLQIKNFYYNSMRIESDDFKIIQTGPVSLGELVNWAKKVPSIKRTYTPYQVIDLVKYEDDWKLFLDAHFQFSSKTERYYHESLAHIPLMLTDQKPKKVLILGGGDGLLARELLKYKNLESLTLVEIDGQMIELGKSLPFSLLNGNSLSDPRLQIHIADAFTWLRRNPATFDAIYIDFPYPYTFEGLRIYSVEFFNLAVRHLSPSGFVMMDIPIFAAGASQWNEHVGTLLGNAGFARSFAFEGNYGETFVIALMKDTRYTFEFREMGVPLQILNKNWFASVEKKIDLNPFHSSHEVNSILKPKRISLPDIWK